MRRLIYFVAAVVLACASVLARGQGLGVYSKLEGPTLTAAAALVADPATGRILWERKGDEVREPASTTKMITALLFIEKVPLTEIIEAPQEVAEVTGSKIGLKPGDKVPAEQILQAILVRSANDACVAAAVKASGSVESFVAEMNRKANDLGCTDTIFKNPHGLHEEGHVSSARDLAKIALAAIKVPEFRAVVSLPKTSISFSGRTPVDFDSRNDLIGEDPTVLGIKTGWTDQAGRCFVGWHKKDGVEFVSVILGCPARWKPDQVALRDWVFEAFEVKELVKKGEVMGRRKVSGALGGPVPLTAVNSLSAMVPKNLQPASLSDVPKFSAPMGRGLKAGKAEWEGGLSVALVASEGRMAWWQPVLSVLAFLWGGAFLIWRRNNLIRARLRAQRQRELEEIRRRANRS